MVRWFISKLTVYKIHATQEQSLTSDTYIKPLEGESDQEYLMRLIMDSPKK